MAIEPQLERRRTPRAAVSGGHECRLDLRTRVRLLDISLTGTLLGSDVRLPPGTRAQVRTALGAAAFEGEITIRRLGGGGALGATFLALDEHSRRRLESFLQRANG